MKKLIMVFAGLLLLAGQAGAATAQTDPKLEDFIFLKYFQDAYHDIEKAMVREKEAITLGSGARFNNCTGYLKEVKTPSDVEDVFSSRLSCSYDVCRVLELLPKLRPHKGWRPKSYAKELYERFDFKSFRNSFRQRMRSGKVHTIADLKLKGVKLKNSYTVTFEEEDWLEELILISDADLNSNGKPDWIIGVMEHARRGTILTCQTVLILDVEPKGLLKVSREMELPSE